MSTILQIDYACRTEAGTKAENADTCDACVPEGAQLSTKGVAACIADGMSASEGGREAAEVCVRGFLADYYSTPDSWTVKTATSRVLGAINRWLCGQGQNRYDSPHGMVCTFSALVVKSRTAHLFHVGDSRIWIYRNGQLEQLTRDHRVWVARDREFLARAMGADANVEIDYRSLACEPGDLFVFTTDGVHDYLTRKELLDLLRRGDGHPQACADAIVEAALRNGSQDNASCQLLRVIALPQEDANDLCRRIAELPFPPCLEPGMRIDGYEILRPLHASPRSEVFLALDTESGEKVVLKTPSENYRDDPAYLDAFLHEEWVGRRARDAHLLRVLEPRNRRFLYNITEYVEGKSLAQWMKDHGRASLAQARGFAAQMVAGLRAMHRLEMVHQDLKPDNVLIDTHGTLKLIDFGSTRVAGLGEIDGPLDGAVLAGTLNYAAPECLRGEPCTRRSDMYSLGVILYELLTGALPYGDTDRPTPRRRYEYTPARRHAPALPIWVDGSLAKAVHPDPRRRYEAMSEFLHDLEHPNPAFAAAAVAARPLLERNPLAFWRGLAGVLAILNLVLLAILAAANLREHFGRVGILPGVEPASLVGEAQHRAGHPSARVRDLCLSAANPMNRVPTPVLDDGSVLFDSPVIRAWLDGLVEAPWLIPASGPEAFGQILLAERWVRSRHRSEPAGCPDLPSSRYRTRTASAGTSSGQSSRLSPAQCREDPPTPSARPLTPRASGVHCRRNPRRGPVVGFDFLSLVLTFPIRY